MAYEDAQGRHEVGEKVTFPDETAQERASFERLIAFGIISLNPPLPGPAPEPSPEPAPEPTPLPGRPRRRS
jgi:hypothetical protein